MVYLHKVSKSVWAVTSEKHQVNEMFTTIEEAAEYMEKGGVPSDEIDKALIDLASFGSCRAHFAYDGRFMRSDTVKYVTSQRG